MNVRIKPVIFGFLLSAHSVLAPKALAQSAYTPYTFTTLAGSAGQYGYADGTGGNARFNGPFGVAVDSAGNIYVADAGTGIRKVTPAGVVTTLAGQAGSHGSADGTNSSARFNYPQGVAVDGAGNVYVADTSNHTIRKVTPSGVVTTLAGLAGSHGTNDGPNGAARFYSPASVAVDSNGNVYVADTLNHTIRKVTPAGGVTTLAGLAQYILVGGTNDVGVGGSADGTNSSARFNYPQGVAVDGAGNVYVADTLNHTIRKVTPVGVVTTLAGQAGSRGSADGTGSAARFDDPIGVGVDSAGNVYVGEASTIRKVTPAGAVTTLAGLAGSFGSTNGTGSAARFNGADGVAVDGAGNVYVTDNETIRKGFPSIQFASPTYAVMANSGFANILVTFGGANSNVVTVEYATSDGTATAGLDYVATNGTVTFLPGATSATFAVPVINNGLEEAPTALNLALSHPMGGPQLGVPTNATLTITPASVHFASPSYDVNENVGFGSVLVTLGGAYTNVVTIDFATSDGTATAGLDYVATNGTLTFLPGQTAAAFRVLIIGGSLVIGPETVNLALNHPSGGAPLGILSNALLTISNNNSLSFDSAVYDVNENVGKMVINVQRHGDLVNSTGAAGYFTSDGTAIAGTDYLTTAGTLIFAPGETNKTFIIPILDDGRVDGDRVFMVNLVAGANFLSQSAVTIHDNETPAAVDLSFNPGDGVMSQYFGSGTVNALALQPDGKILIGGSFDTVEDIGRTNLARLNHDGSLDTNFIAPTGFTDTNGNPSQVSVLAVQTNGQIVVAGNFSSVGGTMAHGLARLNPDGSLDTNFNAFAGIALTNQLMDQHGNPLYLSPALQTLIVQLDGKIVIGGTFDTVNGIARTNLARLNPDGSLDGSFTAGTDQTYLFYDYYGNPYTGASSVSALAQETDGTIIVGGTFAMVNGADRTSLAGLNSDGSLDSSFFVGDGVEDDDNPGTINSINVQANGNVLIAGQFTSVHGLGEINLARLYSTGLMDTSFNSSANRFAIVKAAVGEPDDSVFLAEYGFGWGRVYRIKRLNPDGSPDNNFPAIHPYYGDVNAMLIEPDRNLLIGGSFSDVSVNYGDNLFGFASPGIARIYGNPGQQVVQFADSDISVAEDAGVVPITVQRLGDTSNALRVDYATSNGTAIAGVNYLAVNGTLAFAPLETTKTISILILDDHQVRNDLQFQVALSNLKGSGTLGLRTLTVTIQNADLGFLPGGITRQSNGQVTLSLSASASANYVVEASTNLINWVPLATNVLTLTDSEASQFNKRFYRARLLPP